MPVVVDLPPLVITCYQIGAARGVFAPSLTTQLKIGVPGVSRSPPLLIIFSNLGWKVSWRLTPHLDGLDKRDLGGMVNILHCIIHCIMHSILHCIIIHHIIHCVMHLYYSGLITGLGHNGETRYRAMTSFRRVVLFTAARTAGP